MTIDWNQQTAHPSPSKRVRQLTTGKSNTTEDPPEAQSRGENNFFDWLV